MHAKGGALSLLPSTRRNCRSTKLIAAIVFGAPVPQSCEEISGFPVHTGSTFVVCRSVRQSILILLASWGVPITDITQARSASRKRRSAATDGEIRRKIRWSAKFKRWLESHCTNSNPHVCYHIRTNAPISVGDRFMSKVSPFHSTKPGARSVYHDNDKCTEGNNIERQNLASGTGGRPRCEHCVRLA